MLSSKTFKKRQRVKGLLMGKKNRGLGSNFLICNVLGGVRIERMFPLYSPLVEDIKVLRQNALHKGKKRVRRAKLYYLRGLPLSKSTVKE